MFFERIGSVISTALHAKRMPIYNLSFIFSPPTVSVIQVSVILKVSRTDLRCEGQRFVLSICSRLGMTEYASTLLYVLRDEAVAYLGFCAIMKRVRANFSTDGVAIATKFHHLKVLLQAIDPVYWSFLEACDAGQLLQRELSSLILFAF